MSTLRDLISRVRSTHKLLGGDNLISDRAIAAEIKAANLLLMKRETDKRRLWNTDTVFHSINCLQLEAVSLNECCGEGPQDAKVARSKYKLPKIAEGNHAHLIQGVYNITGNKKIDEVTLNRWINMQKLPIRKKGNFFFIYDGYLYITNPDIQAVRIRAHFEDDIPKKLLTAEDCDACKGSTPDELCNKNPLDQPYKYAGYLEDQIITLTSQKLLGTYFRLNDDKNTDAKDDQVSKT